MIKIICTNHSLKRVMERNSIRNMKNADKLLQKKFLKLKNRFKKWYKNIYSENQKNWNKSIWDKNEKLVYFKDNNNNYRIITYLNNRYFRNNTDDICIIKEYMHKTFINWERIKSWLSLSYILNHQ